MRLLGDLGAFLRNGALCYVAAAASAVDAAFSRHGNVQRCIPARASSLDKCCVLAFNSRVHAVLPRPARASNRGEAVSDRRYW